MKKSLLILVILLVLIITAAGCTKREASEATSQPLATSTTQYWTTTATPTATAADFSKVAMASVTAVKKSWDADPDDDGLAVYPSLEDSAENTVKWSGPSLTVEIEIYTTKFDSNYKQVKNQLVYKGSGTISSWEDGNMFMSGGIRIPFEEIKAPADEQTGWLYATIFTPDGKPFGAVFKYTSLHP